ncbi:hypothetical protein HZH68_004020 [Vespula germanica]|uniref:Uncharacterized protein n=1 Tax=Vespula germanica TaxID=30212 RepID=A0A834NJ11_VESGE|nr:hypothetical protein HZH68_004020 [Vespula germanica]
MKIREENEPLNTYISDEISYICILNKSYIVLGDLGGLNAAERDVSELIMKTAIDQGSIDGIFNFSVSLKDSICRNQTSETFEESFKEKTRAAKCLGEETRKFCQNFCS